MSWHFSQALEEAFWEENFSDGELFAEWKLMPFAADDSCSAKMRGICHRSPFGMMFVPSTDDHGGELLTWFLGDFPVRTSAQQARETCHSWPLRDAPEPFQAAWERSSCKEKGWVALAALRGIWHSEWPGVPRITTGIDSRVDRLQALGNGQVPRCAAEAWRRLIARLHANILSIG